VIEQCHMHDENLSKEQWWECADRIDKITARIREAGAPRYQFRAYLVLARARACAGDEHAAALALKQAGQIAERGPMPLYVADVHLHRARLFRDRAELGKARELIQRHGYWRRKGELEDAEAAAENWPE
jgi:hypothetical protein